MLVRRWELEDFEEREWLQHSGAGMARAADLVEIEFAAKWHGSLAAKHNGFDRFSRWT